MFKKLFLSLALLLSIFTLVACASKTEGPEGPGSVTKTTMYIYQPEDYAVQYLKNLQKEFNREYNGKYKIDMKFYYQLQFYSNLSTAIENGNCPDIYTISYSNLASYVANGYAENLNGYFTETELNDIVPQTASQVFFNGKLYAYPWFLEPSTFLFYRKDILSQVGIGPENLVTYEDIYQACTKLVKNNKVPKAGFPIYIPVGIPRGWATIGMQYNNLGGKYVVSDDWSESYLGEQGIKDLARFYWEVGTNGWCPQQDMTERGFEDAATGLCLDYWLMAFAGSWDIARIMEDYPEYVDKIGIVPAPTLTSEKNGSVYTTATNGGWNFVVSSSSSAAKKEAAIAFIKYAFINEPSRAAEFFVSAHGSRFAPTKTIQKALESVTYDCPKEWVDVVKTVAELGISEPRYSWDIINLVNDLLAESMGADGNDFDSEYSRIYAGQKAKMDVIMSRGERNPYLETDN